MKVRVPCLVCVLSHPANVPPCSAALAQHVYDTAKSGKNSRLQLALLNVRAWLVWLHKQQLTKSSYSPKLVQVSDTFPAGSAAGASYVIRHCSLHGQGEPLFVNQIHHHRMVRAAVVAALRLFNLTCHTCATVALSWDGLVPGYRPPFV